MSCELDTIEQRWRHLVDVATCGAVQPDRCGMCSTAMYEDVPALIAEVRELRRDAIEVGYVNVEIVGKVRALVAHARKISPSPSMTFYVADVERALGIDAPRPHKTGANEEKTNA